MLVSPVTMTTLAMHVGLSCYRYHGQLSRTCIPNLSCDHCSQSCSAKGRL